jgi:HAD superfamily hydrolase (TIGR01509 family)
VRSMVREDLLAAEPADIFPLKPGALEVLTQLREMGVTCALASSAASQEVSRRLNSVKLLDFFTTVVAGDMVERGKPDPALYQLAARGLNTATERCLAFEDSDHGVAAAHAAHVPVVLIPDIATPAEATLERSYCVLPSLADAGPLLGGWFRGD